MLLRSFILIFFLFSLRFFCQAQDLTGIWKGYFITDDGEQYKLEFQIKENNTTSITGVSYSYLDVRFYGKATMSGSINRSDKKFQIQELRTVEVKDLGGGATCLMKYNFTYDKSGREEFLEGTFIGKSEDRKNPKNDGEWGNCGGGKVYLRKVPTSDFYVEPFLRDRPKADTIASIPKEKPAVAKKSPSKTNPSIKTNHVVKNNPVKNSRAKNTTSKNNHPIVKNKPVVIKHTTTPITDSTRETVVTPLLKDPIAEKKIITSEVLKTRENALVQTIIVNTESVTIRLYDNGEIDGDSISVFVDKKLVLSHQGLSTVPITLTLKFNADNDEHEVIMVAENLGRIPPNTSLMVINAGDKRYHVQISSTEQKNALVRFKYEKPSQ